MPKTAPITHPVLLRNIDRADKRGAIRVEEVYFARQTPDGLVHGETYQAPNGLVWFDDRLAVRFCRDLGIEFTPALQGFCGVGDTWPIYGGIVLPAEDLPRLQTAILGRLSRREENREAIRAKAHAKLPTAWEQLGDDAFEIDNA